MVLLLDYLLYLGLKLKLDKMNNLELFFNKHELKVLFVAHFANDN